MRRSNGPTLPLIMIADNDEHERCLLKAVLKLKGFNVVEAADGQEAINVATKRLPDLSLIELNLPVVSGPSVIRELRKSTSLRWPLMVAVSLSKATRGKRVIAPGFRAHLDKPVEFDLLDTVIDHLFPGSLQLAARVKSPKMDHANRLHVSS